jgi:hypothetical protein
VAGDHAVFGLDPQVEEAYEHVFDKFNPVGRDRGGEHEDLGGVPHFEHFLPVELSALHEVAPGVDEAAGGADARADVLRDVLVELLFVLDVPIEGGCFYAELTGKRAHSQLLDALPVQKADGRLNQCP